MGIFRVSIPKPLLDPESLPATLWDKDKKFLYLPEKFSAAYARLVDRYNLRALATSRTEKDSPTGGISKADTEQHFAQQFDNSAARAQLALTDVTGNVTNVSDALVRALSGNTIVITDAPCGAGAATFAFLCAIAELRAYAVFPRMRLEVRLIGAEISEHARFLAMEMLHELRPYFESQAIFVEAKFYYWDVTNKLSTTDLNKATVCAGGSKSNHLLVVANFSGFLSMPGKLTASKAQLEEMFRYCSGAESVAVWLEPQMNFATHNGGILQSISQWIKDKWHDFSRVVVVDGQKVPYVTSSTNFISTLTPERPRSVRLAAMRVDLKRS
jgi:hypothetical protein